MPSSVSTSIKSSGASVRAPDAVITGARNGAMTGCSRISRILSGAFVGMGRLPRIRDSLDREVLRAHGLVGGELSHRPGVADAPLLDDVGAVGDERREMQVLLGEDDRQALALQRPDGF